MARNNFRIQISTDPIINKTPKNVINANEKALNQQKSLSIANDINKQCRTRIKTEMRHKEK